MATPNFVTPQQTIYPVPYPNIPQVPTFTPAPGIPPAMSNFYQPPLPVVAPVPMATVLPVTAADATTTVVQSRVGIVTGSAQVL